MGTELVILIFDPRVLLLYIEYLNKGTVWEAEILGIFITHLGLYMGKVSLKSVRSIEHLFRILALSFVQWLLGAELGQVLLIKFKYFHYSSSTIWNKSISNRRILFVSLRATKAHICRFLIWALFDRNLRQSTASTCTCWYL